MLRIIGDIHGKAGLYKGIVRDANANGICTLQLGDLGFGDTYSRLMIDLAFDVSLNKFFMGNHDQYDYTCKELNPDSIKRFSEFCIGHYGLYTHGGVKFYFVRGAFSIDYKHRTTFRSWWPDEEIAVDWHEIIINNYLEHKPDIMITHEIPQNIGHDGVLKTDWILKEFGFNPKTFSTKTGELLQKLFEVHQPKLWLFGHYHKDWTATVNGTKFQCLPEAGYVDLIGEENG